MDKVAELEAQLKAAREEAQAAAKAEGQAIYAARKHVWWVEWTHRWTKAPSDYVFTAYRQLTDETIAAMEAWENANPGVSKPWSLRDVKAIESMTYILISNMLTHVGGGTILLKGAEGVADAFSHEPRPITDLEAQALKNGKVPESLRR